MTQSTGWGRPACGPAGAAGAEVRLHPASDWAACRRRTAGPPRACPAARDERQAQMACSRVHPQILFLSTSGSAATGRMLPPPPSPVAAPLSGWRHKALRRQVLPSDRGGACAHWGRGARRRRPTLLRPAAGPAVPAGRMRAPQPPHCPPPIHSPGSGRTGSLQSASRDGSAPRRAAGRAAPQASCRAC